MAGLCDGEIIFFGSDPTLPAIVAHRAAGGRAILLTEGNIAIATGLGQDVIVSLEAAAPQAGSGRDIWRGGIAIECLLAAVGAACALNLRADLIATAIHTFIPDYAGAEVVA